MEKDVSGKYEPNEIWNSCLKNQRIHFEMIMKFWKWLVALENS